MKRSIVKLFSIAVLPVFFLVACSQKDADIQTQLNEKLFSNPNLSAVTATVDKGMVTFSGRVKSSEAKMAAEAAAKEVKGVKSIENNIVVDSLEVAPAPVPVVANDSSIISGVADATKDFPTVTATVHNGEVTLTGTIKREHLDHLMQSLSSLNPKKINNQLTIE